VLNSPGVQDGGFLLEVDGNAVIDRADLFYRDRPREPDSNPTPACDSNSDLDDGRGLLDSLLGGLFSASFVPSSPCDMAGADARTDPLVQEEALENDDDACIDDCSEADVPQEADDPVGFRGVFFRHVLSARIEATSKTLTLTLSRTAALSLGVTTRILPRRKTSLSGLRIFRFISTILNDSLCIFERYNRFASVAKGYGSYP